MKSWNADELIRFSGSYWGVCALHAAVNLDVFTPLQDAPLTAAELAARLDCPERGLSMLLTALCALSLLENDTSGRFRLTEFSRNCLCRGSEAYLGYIISHHSQLMPGWSLLAEAVRKNHPTRGRIAAADNPDERKNFLMGMYNMALVRAEQAVNAVTLEGKKRLLDLGGGPGTYAVRFCAANPALSAIIFDQETSRPFAEDIIRRNKMESRVSFSGGNFFESPLPEGCDAVWMSHILHGMDDAKAEKLLARVLKTASPGALILIQEFVLDDSKNGPLFPALFALNMLTGTPNGKAYTWKELENLLSRAGAKNIRRISLPGNDGSGIVAGEK